MLKNQAVCPLIFGGRSGRAMALGKLSVLGRPTIWMIVEQGPTAFAVGAGGGEGGCLDIFTLIYPFSALSLPLWETARYRLKHCLEGPLNPKQPTNQPLYLSFFLCFQSEIVSYVLRNYVS